MVTKFFKSPLAQFVVFVSVVVIYAVATGTSVQSVLENMVPTPTPTATPSSTPRSTSSPAVQGASTASDSAVVSEVIDGDTIRLSSGERLRYIGIDTPETKDPRRPKECYGEEASRYNEQLVLGKTVQLEKDVSETDKYGRLLRYVWLDGEMVNEKLVKEGYANAISYPPDIKYQSVFKAAEKDARVNNRGLWKACGTTN